ncbi:MAG: hypothetical protein IIA45_07280 [Bacteroidetes bacterium]|nr:hypothetical protein [Bacteroidota bacterium]
MKLTNLIITLLFLVFWSCQQQSVDNFKMVEVNMSAKEVKKLLGDPEQIVHLGSIIATGEKIEVWYYGHNRSIGMNDGKVSNITEDIKRETEILQTVIEANRSGDTATVNKLLKMLGITDEDIKRAKEAEDVE